MKKVSAKKLREMLADIQAHNEGRLFKAVQPAPPVITHRPANRHQRARWVVTRVGYKTDPEHGHFLDGGNKIFPISSADHKQSELVRAIGWASEKYGYEIGEWEKTPFGSWTPKSALETALRHYLPELFETSVYVPPTVLPDMRPLAEAVQHVSSIETDGWYRVLGANVAVFIQATSEHDAKTRVEHMINRMTMDVTLDLHITKRDPEVG